jgi:hypothetical protein
LAHDFEIEPGLFFGTWLHEQIAEAARIEKSGFFAIGSVA